MRLGCGWPTLGPGAGPDALTRGDQRAEALGYHSAWVADRLLCPVAPRSPYPVGDGTLPVVLTRWLATLDRLSGVRLRVGLGHAWSGDELGAVGADPTARASRADEFLRVLEAMWAPGPTEFQGRHFCAARSIVGLKPTEVIAWTGGATLGFLAGLERFREAAG